MVGVDGLFGANARTGVGYVAMACDKVGDSDRFVIQEFVRVDHSKIQTYQGENEVVAFP